MFKVEEHLNIKCKLQLLPSYEKFAHHSMQRSESFRDESHNFPLCNILVD